MTTFVVFVISHLLIVDVEYVVFDCCLLHEWILPKNKMRNDVVLFCRKMFLITSAMHLNKWSVAFIGWGKKPKEFKKYWPWKLILDAV